MALWTVPYRWVYETNYTSVADWDAWICGKTELYIYIYLYIHIYIFMYMYLNMYMGGLALMVISPKLEIFTLLYVHIVDYSTTFEVF